MASPPPLSDKGLFDRPPAETLQTAWSTLFSDPLLSLANLKAAGAGMGLGPAADDGGVLLRSVYWRFYLGLLPPPTSLDLFPPVLTTMRRVYDELCTRYLVAPDGRWAADCSGGKGYAPSPSKAPSATGGWDPLSLDGESPWKTWFAHLDLRATIRQDVDRTFPDIPYFTIERVRRSLTTMLFLFAVLNPDVGYRQGMHELLAVCLLVVDRDSLDVGDPSSPPDPKMPAEMAAAMTATLDRAYIEHDAFALFQELMRPAKPFYEWRAEEGPPSRAPKAPPAPIITRCNHIHSQLIRRIDPQLWERLETEGVEAQIWAIRWLRLVLTRELPFEIALRLWDGIFAVDPGLGILDFVCVAMLLLVRNDLIDGDYPAILTLLLHYPSPSETYPFNPALILAQAQHLRDNVSPAAGVEVVLQNQELLGVRAGGSEKPKVMEDLPVPGGFFGRGTPSPRPGSSRGKTKAGVQGIAAGLFERAQKAGLDKAIFSTVADLRSSLPDTSAYSAYLPTFSPQAATPSRENSPFSTIPSTTAAVPPRTPLKPDLTGDSTSTKSMLDAERQMAEVRLTMLGMGKAMSGWLDVLQDSAGDAESKEAAWRGLERVRDSLLDAAGCEVDDMVKNWAWNDGLDTSRSRTSSAAPTPVTPIRSSFPPSPTPDVTQDTPKALGKVQQAAQEEAIQALSSEASPSKDGRRSDELAMSPTVRTPSLAFPPPAAVSPGLPPAPGAAMYPGDSQPSGLKPPLYLSTRTDRPSPTLTRVPMSQRMSPPGTSPRGTPETSARSPGTPNTRIVTPTAVSASTGYTPTIAPANGTVNTPPSLSPPQHPSPPTSGSPGGIPMDPLAGLDVGSMSTSSKHERRRSAYRVGSHSPAGSKPVGVDPLGVSG